VRRELLRITERVGIAGAMVTVDGEGRARIRNAAIDVEITQAGVSIA
jgi:hypothetical protein